MKEQLEARMNELKAELETGRQMIQELDEKRTNLGYTLTRISGGHPGAGGAGWRRRGVRSGLS
ncbi:hypothetical protein ACFTAO_27620 [Paenibacillus rhizoplanae]